MSQVTSELITELVAHIQNVVILHYATTFPEETDIPQVSTDFGKRYIRLVLNHSAYGFIDTETGDLLKSASWKAPSKNYARGSLFQKETWKCCGIYSLR